MDFVMDAVDLGERGVAGCLTRWINLGAGLHPADPKWRSHLGKSLPERVTYQPHPLASIRLSFENQTAISFEDFTARNVYNLLSRRERQLITGRVHGFIWKLVCSDPHRWCLEHAEESLGWALARISRFLYTRITKHIGDGHLSHRYLPILQGLIQSSSPNLEHQQILIHPHLAYTNKKVVGHKRFPFLRIWSLFITVLIIDHSSNDLAEFNALVVDRLGYIHHQRLGLASGVGITHDYIVDQVVLHHCADL